MTRRKVFALITALTVGGLSTAHAQQPATPTYGTAKTARKEHAAAPAQGQTKRVAASAKVAVSADSARALVLARTPKATIVSSKLHRRAGRLMYDVKFREEGQRAVHVLRVDATTGAITEVPMAASASQKAHKRS